MRTMLANFMHRLFSSKEIFDDVDYIYVASNDKSFAIFYTGAVFDYFIISENALSGSSVGAWKITDKIFWPQQLKKPVVSIASIKENNTNKLNIKLLTSSKDIINTQLECERANDNTREYINKSINFLLSSSLSNLDIDIYNKLLDKNLYGLMLGFYADFANLYKVYKHEEFIKSVRTNDIYKPIILEGDKYSFLENLVFYIENEKTVESFSNVLDKYNAGDSFHSFIPYGIIYYLFSSIFSDVLLPGFYLNVNLMNAGYVIGYNIAGEKEEGTALFLLSCNESVQNIKSMNRLLFATQFSLIKDNNNFYTIKDKEKTNEEEKYAIIEP